MLEYISGCSSNVKCGLCLSFASQRRYEYIHKHNVTHKQWHEYKLDPKINLHRLTNQQQQKCTVSTNDCWSQITHPTRVWVKAWTSIFFLSPNRTKNIAVRTSLWQNGVILKHDCCSNPASTGAEFCTRGCQLNPFQTASLQIWQP